MLSHILKLHNYAALTTGLMQRVVSEFSRSISDTTRAEIGGGGTTLYFSFSYIFIYILYIIHKLNSVMILLVISYGNINDTNQILTYNSRLNYIDSVTTILLMF